MNRHVRLLQMITGIHRIHHVDYSYGYKLPLLKVGYFNDESYYKQFGFRRIKGRGKDYHNCTISGVY